MFKFPKLQAPLRQIWTAARMRTKITLCSTPFIYTPNRPKINLFQNWMAAKTGAKIHHPKPNLIQRSDEILTPSVPCAFGFSGILMANQNQETNEMWKTKCATVVSTRLGANIMQPLKHGLGLWTIHNQVLAGKVDSIASLRDNMESEFVDAAVESHLYLLLLIMDSTPLQNIISDGDSTSSLERTVLIMADGSYLWEPEGAGVGGWIKDLTSNTFLEAFQATCTGCYRHPSTALLEYVAPERAYKRVLAYPYKYDRIIFVSDSETFLLEFDLCLKGQRYPKLPRRGDPTYKEKLACYHSLKRLLKKIPPGTAIKLEKISRAKNKLPDLLSKMGRKTNISKVYRSVQQIKEGYEKAKAKGIKLPKIGDREWGNLTKIPPTSGYGFIVWNPKG